MYNQKENKLKRQITFISSEIGLKSPINVRGISSPQELGENDLITERFFLVLCELLMFQFTECFRFLTYLSSQKLFVGSSIIIVG